MTQIIDLNIQDIHNKATMSAKTAVHDFLQDWNEKTGGNEYGEPMYCGFAWVDVRVERTNSKEAKMLESIGFKKNKGVVVHNGYDTNSFFQDSSLENDIRNELGISNETFVIGHVGSYNPLKDQETLIKSKLLI